MITTFNISLVIKGSIGEMHEGELEEDPYAVAKELGIFRVIESSSRLTTSDIISRIWHNRDQFIKRNEKKAKRRAR